MHEEDGFAKKQGQSGNLLIRFYISHRMPTVLDAYYNGDGLPNSGAQEDIKRRSARRVDVTPATKL